MAVGAKVEEARVDIPCTEEGCPWVGHNVPERRVNSIRGMHMTAAHPDRFVAKDISHRAKALRQGAEAQFLTRTTKETVKKITKDLDEGFYRPGEQMVLAQLMTRTGVGLTAVRGALWHLTRQQPPLVRQKDGKFFALNLPATAEPVPPPATQPSRSVSRLVKTTARRLQSQLGTRFPVGEVLPRAAVLAKEFGVSLATMQRAFVVLNNEGVIDVKRGRGATFVLAAPPAESEYEPPAPPAEPEPKPAEPEPPADKDEPVEKVQAALPNGDKGVTGRPDPLAAAFSFLTRLADIGATAELQRLWKLEESTASSDDLAKLQAEVDRRQAEVAQLQTELGVAQGENRSLISGINTLREEKATNQQQYRTLKQSYTQLQAAHQEILDEYRHHLSVAQLIGAPSNGPVSKLSVEAALSERKPLPARRSY